MDAVYGAHYGILGSPPITPMEQVQILPSMLSVLPLNRFIKKMCLETKVKLNRKIPEHSLDTSVKSGSNEKSIFCLLADLARNILETDPKQRVAARAYEYYSGS